MSDLIDRQAAIDAICEHGTDLERRGITVLSVANYKQVTVDLLENLPSAQPVDKDINVPINDTISRKMAIDTFDGTKVDETDCTEYDIGYNDGIDFAVSKLSVLPSVQPEITQEDVELYCRQRCLTVITNELFTEMKLRWSAQPERKTKRSLKRQG